MVHKGQQTRQRAFLIGLPAPRSQSQVTQDQVSLRDVRDRWGCRAH